MTRPSPLTPEAIEKEREEYKQREDYKALGRGQQDLALSSKSPWLGMLAPECRYSNVPASEYIKYNSRDGKDDYDPQFENIEAVKNEWTRHNAFLARLVMNPDLPHRNTYLGRAFEALVPALEDIQESNDFLSADGPVAAVWLVYAGDALFETEISG